MLDRRGFLLSACASLAAVPLAGLASEHGGRKVVDGFTVNVVCSQEFRDLHFRTPIRTSFAAGCRFTNCSCDSYLLESIPGTRMRALNCYFQVPDDFKGKGCIAV